MVEPGVPVDPADLQNVPAPLPEGCEQVLPQVLHGIVQSFYILALIGRKPVPVIIHADSPEKINRLRSKALKHRVFLFLSMCLPSHRRRETNWNLIDN